jgi:hypothetical protein
MRFELSFTNKEITPWGGMLCLKQMLDRIGFRKQREYCESLPVLNSNRAYSILLLLESFITGIWRGANRFLHTEIIRPDRAPGKIFGWKATPGRAIGVNACRMANRADNGLQPDRSLRITSQPTPNKNHNSKSFRSLHEMKITPGPLIAGRRHPVAKLKRIRGVSLLICL